MISSKSASICNHFHARLVDSSRNHTFGRGYPNLTPPYGRLLEPRGSKLKPLKSAFNLPLMLQFHTQVVLVYLQ